METIDWNALYEAYAAHRDAVRSREMPARPFVVPDAAVIAFGTPADEDIRWLTGALCDEKRKRLVVSVASRAQSVAEAFFAPLLDAAINEVDPSFNRYFIEPCVKAFGYRRVNEYLLAVVEHGSDFRRAGAVNALYWAQVPLSFRGTVPSYTIEHATPESRAAYEAMSDVRERMRRLLLDTFVSNPNVDVRRSIIPKLNLDASDYPETHSSLVAQAIAIARSSEDEYIRHRVEVQLGAFTLLKALPHRKNPAGQG